MAMQLVRIPFAVIVGGMFTTAVFWLLWSLVSTSFDTGERVEATRIEFSRMRRDTEATTKREEKVERERPPPTPDTPRLTFSAGGVDNNIARLTPIVDARAAISRMTLTAGSDRDVIPLVRVNPDYPPRAATRGQEGWVQVRFTITATGTVKDAIVVDAMPPNVFDDAALKAIVRWRYNPKVENGVAVERVGVQTKIVFQLEE
jgi:protein TonB